jgi:hypothetical protein
MKSRLNLKPGQRGTKKLVDRYGKSLLYVRYRYDEIRGVRLKTVEIIVEEKPWQPSMRIKDDEIVPVNVYFTEMELREKLKGMGGKWNPEEKCWYVHFGVIRGTKFEYRIPEGFIKSRRGKKHPE